MQLDPGRPVRCRDAPFGELADVVVDPRARRVTHVVVQPQGDPTMARLVPAELIDASGEPELTLRCTRAEAEALPHVRELAYQRLGSMPLEDPRWEVGITTVLAMPASLGTAGLDTALPFDDEVEIAYDRVPRGTVELQRGSSVLDAAGRRLGHVGGVTVGADGAITQLVLEHGHLWGRRDVTIPVDAIASVENDAVTLSLTHAQVAALPAVRARRHR